VGDQGSEVSNPDAPPSEGLFVAGNQVPDSLLQQQKMPVPRNPRNPCQKMPLREIGHPAAEVARTLGISRVGVLLSLEKAKETRPKYGFELTPPNLTDSIC
jgi:hypothetical protein